VADHKNTFVHIDRIRRFRGYFYLNGGLVFFTFLVSDGFYHHL
jgi:hypothetical protein